MVAANSTGAEKSPLPNPYREANPLSRLTFWWLRHLFRAGLHETIDESHIYALLPEDGSAALTADFDAAWQAERLIAKRPSLFRVLRQQYMMKLLPVGVVCYVLDIACRLIAPQCLGILVTYFTPTSSSADTPSLPAPTVISTDLAVLCAAGICLCSLTSAINLHNLWMYFMRLGMRLRLTMTTMIYRKSLRIAGCATPAGLTGHCINLMSTDVTRFNTTLVLVHDLWRGPLELVLMTWLIWREIGVFGLWGVGCMVVLLPLQAWASQRTAVYRKRSVQHGDDRMRLIGEVVQAIEVIKLYTWERWFAGQVDETRRAELRSIRANQLLNGFLGMMRIVAKVALFVALSAYAYWTQRFEARQVFVVTTYFNYIYASMFLNWSLAWSMLAQLRVSVHRIERYLLLAETKEELMAARKSKVDRIRKISEDRRPGIRMNNATASWRTETKCPTTGLQGCQLSWTEPGLYAVIGAVGTGKSTLLQIILGELGCDAGEVEVHGLVSYAAQEAWVFDGTVRENILFQVDGSSPFDAQRYERVVAACALQRDLYEWPAGDATVVGERGVCLSGGQRARISLARAVYKRADIYLLDDVLSAVDSTVGRHIFNECILGLLADKICVLVTHQLQYLQRCEHTLMMEGGKIVAQESFERMQQTKGFALLANCLTEQRQTETEGEEKRQKKKSLCEEAADRVTGKTDKKTERPAELNQVGRVGKAYYMAYFKAVQNNWLVVAVGLSFVMAQLTSSATDYFVSKKVSVRAVAAMHDDESQRIQLMQTYGCLVLSIFVAMTLRVLGFFQMCVRASRNLHRMMYSGLTGTDVWFFKTTATGRILNRFSRDMDNIDTNLPVAFNGVLTVVLEILAIVLLVMLTNWWLLGPTVLLFVVLYLVRYTYMQTSLSIKRIEASTLSPLFSHTNATLQGITTIRAFNAQQHFAAHFDQHQDRNTCVRFLFITTNQAFALWLEVATVVYMSAVILSFVYLQHDDSAGGRVGLAVTQLMNQTMLCKFGMRHSAILENQMTSIERVCEYSALPAEEDQPTEAEKVPSQGESGIDWPPSGAIEFQSVSLRYSQNSGASALHDISLRIKPREKIGICGRTGAGKSSIIQALFRLAPTEGRILIDERDTRLVPLAELRSSIAIIPQQAALFTGTVRTNLDPFGKHRDEDLWQALEQVELRAQVASRPGGLDAKVGGDAASGFSMGQKQLVCLARAILRRSRILVLDEATANVDAETDRLIQRTIRERFAECTVLTIAHRLQTIEDSDRVLVMDAGRVVEFDRPDVLRRRERGHFARMGTREGGEAQ